MTCGHGARWAAMASIGRRLPGWASTAVSSHWSACCPPVCPTAIDLHGMYPYNPEQARQLLHETGYDGKHPLRFTILVGNQEATLGNLATLIKNQLAESNVEAKMHLVDQTTWIDHFGAKHAFEMGVSNFGS